MMTLKIFTYIFIQCYVKAWLLASCTLIPGVSRSNLCWIRVESVFQVIFDLQGVAMSNLLPDVVCIEWSILGRIS